MPPLLCAGGKVLDLGCVPGAWLQVSCQQLGPHDRGGLVLGVDIQEVRGTTGMGEGEGSVRPSPRLQWSHS